MQVLVAILLSASLLLASGSYQPSQTGGADGSRLIQLIQMLVAQAGTVQKSATTTERTAVHSAPSSLAKSEGQLAAGTQVTIIRSETVLNVRRIFLPPTITSRCPCPANIWRKWSWIAVQPA